MSSQNENQFQSNIDLISMQFAEAKSSQNEQNLMSLLQQSIIESK
jgi:hypothetical protein